MNSLRWVFICALGWWLTITACSTDPNLQARRALDYRFTYVTYRKVSDFEIVRNVTKAMWDEGTVSTLWQLSMTQNDFIEIFVENQTDATDITVMDIIFRAN